MKDPLPQTVYKCLRHGTIMKPIFIKAIEKNDEYWTLEYSMEVCQKCIEEGAQILYTIAPDAPEPKEE